METRRQTCISCKKKWDAPDVRPLRGCCDTCMCANNFFYYTLVTMFIVGVGYLILYGIIELIARMFG